MHENETRRNIEFVDVDGSGEGDDVVEVVDVGDEEVDEFADPLTDCQQYPAPELDAVEYVGTDDCSDEDNEIVISPEDVQVDIEEVNEFSEESNFGSTLWNFLGAKANQSFMSGTLNCDICGRSFSRIETLKRHMRIHLGTNRLSCPICNKRLSRQDKLKMHMEKLHNAKSLGRVSKPKVQKTTKLIENRKRKRKEIENLLINLEERNLKENEKVSEEQAKKVQDSKNHIEERKLPENEKVVELQETQKWSDAADGSSCKLCGKQFTAQPSLKRHIETQHTGKKRHQCTICNKFLSRTDHLKRHMAIKHSGKSNQFDCQLCNETCNSQYRLEQHHKKIHVNEVIL